MAENESSGWWDGWIQAAKQKSASAIEFVKKDLTEFTSTMQHDTTAVASDVKSKISSENARAATKKAKEGVSQLIGGLSKALVVEAEDKVQKTKSSSSNRHIFDRAQARLNAIQVDPGTYCEEPLGSKEEFNEWLKSFNLEKQKGDISELLVVNVEVRALYTQLVPSKVSHADFWQRYFYKLYQLKQDENRKAALMKRADDVQQQVDWDDDDDWGDLDGPSSPPHQGGMHLVAKELAVVRKETNDNDDECSITSSDRCSDITAGEDKDINDCVISSERESVGALEIRSDDNEIAQNTEILAEKYNENVSKVELTQSPTDDSSLSISSITDISVPDNLQHMESSSDTLTLVSPLEEVTTDTNINNEDPLVVPSSSPSRTCLTKMNNEQDKTAQSEEKEIKTKVKGDMVVVGSGASSERTTPSSTASSNKETEDEWEKEFEVTEDDLAQHTTEKLKIEATLPDELEDDWESWD